jgi:site-specific recombinase XerC
VVNSYRSRQTLLPELCLSQIAKLGQRRLNRRISAHTFWHSLATRKIKETRKIQAVSEYLGHSSVATTLSLYCHDELSVEDLSSETDMIGIVAA